MIVVSCSSKFHAFNLAEELDRKGELVCLYTTFAYQKNIWFRKYTKRKDFEKIDKNKIKTNIFIAILMKLIPHEYIWNQIFDIWVANQLKKRNDFSCFIGWSGMSIRSLDVAKQKGCCTFLERGSTHIKWQNDILRKEYLKYEKKFSISKFVIKQEIEEYTKTDFITIPSQFVKMTFLEYSVPEIKLFVNNYGVSDYFLEKKLSSFCQIKQKTKIRVLYLGTLSIRKGAMHLLKGLSLLDNNSYQFHIIGKIEPEIMYLWKELKRENWHDVGFINHYELFKYISEYDVLIQPSIEEGLSMVLLQAHACGLPIVATKNSGAEEIVRNNENGILIGAGISDQIYKSVLLLINQPEILTKFKEFNRKNSHTIFTWSNYANRYIEKIIKQNTND